MKWQINWPRFWVSACFFYEQNSYFGWNAWPKSDAELIADGIGLLLTAISFERKP